MGEAPSAAGKQNSETVTDQRGVNIPPPERIPILSFFVGGGLMDMGFEMAGFDVVWTNECEPAFIAGYELGMTSWRLSQDVHRLAQISCTDRIENTSAEKIASAAFPNGRPPLFGIIGGPPCPDFSDAGKHRGRNGAHGKLSEVFVDRICHLEPDFFVFENVPGLLRTHRNREFFSELVKKLENSPAKYVCDHTTLNALDFGVPQDRKRVFLVGFKPQFFETHFHTKYNLLLHPTWFPWPKPKYRNALDKYAWPEVHNGSGEPVRPNGIPKELMVKTYLDGSNRPDLLPNGNEQFIPYSNRFHDVQEGDISHKSFKRLHRWRYSPTAAYGNNEVHLHPWEDRRLSVREVMRLQSIPDEYILPASMTLSEKYKMIANGVPVKLAFSIAISVKQFISKA